MLDKIKNKLPQGNESPALKMIIVGVLTLLMMIPMGMIESVITERHYRLRDTQQEISNNWGAAQQIGGPILTIPYKVIHEVMKQNSKGNWYTTHEIKIEYAYFLPDRLNIESHIEPQIRYRGLYKMPVYRSQLKFWGQFTPPDFDTLDIEKRNVLWDKAFISVKIKDKKGLNEIPILNWNDQLLPFGPISKPIHNFESVAQVALGDAGLSENQLNSFSFKLDLRGSQSLEFLPFGKQTRAAVVSNWKTPKFYGTSLPAQHKIRESGFSAEWKVLELNRNYPQQWKQGEFDADVLHASTFGVELLLPVSVYLQTTRSVKYAILYIVLTFTAFFMFETLGKLRIHPLQYLLIGLSICLFYLNLLSISEHITFNRAYLIATLGTVGLIFGYSIAVLRSKPKAAIIAAILTTLYGFLFILLKSETYSLLIGTIGLFVILGTIMYITRKLDWYNPAALNKA